MSEHISARRHAHVPASECAAASVILRVKIIALFWNEARDVATRADGDIAARRGADSAKIGCIYFIVRRAVLRKSESVIVSPGVHITRFRCHGNTPVVESSDPVPRSSAAHLAGAERRVARA